MFWFKIGSFRFEKILTGMSWCLPMATCVGPTCTLLIEMIGGPRTHCLSFHPLFSLQLCNLHCSSLHLQFGSICYMVSIWRPGQWAVSSKGKLHGCVDHSVSCASSVKHCFCFGKHCGFGFGSQKICHQSPIVFSNYFVSSI